MDFCPFVASDECEIPPCKECFLNCPYRAEAQE